MKTSLLTLTLLAVPLALAGCSGGRATDAPKGEGATPKATGPEAAEAEVHAALSQLPEEDRRLAEAQKFCAVEDENRLGAMGAPFKILVKGQPVFLCCKGCRKQALADPDKTLEKVKALKEKAAREAGK